MKDVKIESFSIELPDVNSEQTTEVDYPNVSVSNPRQPAYTKIERFKAFSTIIGGFILMLFSGSIYTLGNISPYITSYYHLPD